MLATKTTKNKQQLKNRIYASINKPPKAKAKGGKFWQIKSYLNKNNKAEAEILLYGAIGDDRWGDVTSKEFAAELKNVENAEIINVRINSPGGDVFAGQAIFSMLKRCTSQIIVYIDGLAASIASLVAMAGDKVIMPKNSMLMIHKPWSCQAGNAVDMRERADTLDKVEESMLGAYVNKTGLDKEEIKTMLADETWLTAEEALQKGFADEIEDNEVKAQINGDILNINGQDFNLADYKKFNASWFNNKAGGVLANSAESDKTLNLNLNINLQDTLTKERKKTTMDLRALCKAFNLDYDALIKAGMNDEEIKKMVQAKMQESDNGDDGNGANNLAQANAQAAASIKAEKERVESIAKLGEEYNAKEKALKYIADGKSVEDFKDELLKDSNNDEKPAKSDFGIGMSIEDATNFSFFNLINALANPQDRTAQANAKRELELCAAAGEKYGVKNKGTVIPVEALLAPALKNAVNTTSAGALIETKLETESFIDLLRNKSVIMQLARQLNGLVGNVDIPKQTAGTSGYWVGEDTAATSSDPAFGILQLRMKTVSANTYLTRTMLKQSSIDLENFVREDLALALALAIDKAGFYGSGSSNQPKGIINTTGVNAVQFAGKNPTYGELVDMETAIAVDNADVNDMAYIVNPTTKGHCKQTLKSSGVSGYIWEDGNKLNGYRAIATNQINEDDVVLGNFADLILGMFGGLEIIVDPYTNSTKGGVVITAFQDVDFGARHAESFCVGKAKEETQTSSGQGG